METSIKARLTFAVTLMISATLCVVVLGMVSGLLIGLFDEKVDNNKIFEMISPAFQTVIGGFIGLLAGVKLSHDESQTPSKKD